MSKKNIIFLLGIVCGVIGLFVAYRYRAYPSYTISPTQVRTQTNIVPMLILGSGPAGLSAALYAARSHIPTIVLLGSKPGGALMETTYVENWPGIDKLLGSQIIDKLTAQATLFGAQFLSDYAVAIDTSSWPYKVTTADGHEIYALSIVIATGSTPRTLGIDGERAYWGKGVTTCAICDAPFHKGHDVVVIGGGDSAVEEALQLTSYAKSVTILVRKGAMRAAPTMQDRLKTVSNVRVVYNVSVQKIIGTSEVTAIDVLDHTTDTKFTMNVQGVFLAIGHDPNTGIFVNHVGLDDQGYIRLNDRSQKTNIPGIFAAGDVADPTYKQAGVSSGDGIKAALDAVEFLMQAGFTSDVLAELSETCFAVSQYQCLEVEKIDSLAQLTERLETTPGLVVVDFYAPHCPSCMRMLPIVENIAFQFQDHVTFLKVDTSEHEDIAQRYKVTSIPLLMSFQNGQLLARNTNAMDKHELHMYISSLIEQ